MNPKKIFSSLASPFQNYVFFLNGQRVRNVLFASEFTGEIHYKDERITDDSGNIINHQVIAFGKVEIKVDDGSYDKPQISDEDKKEIDEILKEAKEKS